MGTIFSQSKQALRFTLAFSLFLTLFPQATNAQLFGGFSRGYSSGSNVTSSGRSYTVPTKKTLPANFSQPAASVPDPSITTVRTVQAASTSWAAQREVQGSIPWKKLSQNASQKIKGVVQAPSIYRRLPVNQIECDPQFFTFAIRNPETVVNMWKVFGVSQMTLQKQAPYQFSGSDGSGTTCTAELIYGDSNIHIYYGTGVYQGPVFRRRITGRCVAVVRTGYFKGKDQYVLENKMDIFLKVDNLAADLVARSLQPMVGKSTDHNFRESLAFLQAFSSTATTQPHRTSYLIHKMPGVGNDIKSQFHKIVASIPNRKVEYQKKFAPKTLPAPAGKPGQKPKNYQGSVSASVGSPAVYRSIR